MRPDQTKTGINELDAELSALHDYLDNNRDQIDWLKSLIESGEDIEDTIGDSELRDAIPARPLRIALLLSDTKSFDELAKLLQPEARPALEEARERVREELGMIVYSRKIRGIVVPQGQEDTGQPGAPASDTKDTGEESERSAAPSPSEDDTGNDRMRSAFAASLRVPHTVNHMSLYFGSAPSLLPLVRVMVADNQSQVIGDWTAEWDDLLFMARALMRICREHMQEASALVDAGQLELDESVKHTAGVRLAELETLISDVRAVSGKFGIPDGDSVATGDDV